MKVMRKIIEIDEERCTGCGQCAIACAEGAIEIVDGKAKVISDNLCDGLGACIGDCPEDALKIIEREAEDFDEEAVEQHLSKRAESGAKETPACGCPSSQVQSLSPAQSPCANANQPASFVPAQSSLGNWPVQITLVPPNAPFLKQADLLVSADCVPFSFPAFHAEFLKGRPLMVGCPKLDNAQAYIDKFAQIFQTADLKSITCVIMEVPCCSGLPMILQKAMEASGIKVPMAITVISTRGQILETRKV